MVRPLRSLFWGNCQALQSTLATQLWTATISPYEDNAMTTDLNNNRITQSNLGTGRVATQRVADQLIADAQNRSIVFVTWCKCARPSITIPWAHPTH